MTPTRKALSWALLYLGVAGVFSIVFTLSAFAGFRYGLYPGLAVFCGLVAAITVGLSALFINDRVEEEEDDGWCGGAVEGANVYSLPLKGQIR